MFYLFDGLAPGNPCRWIDKKPFIRGVRWTTGARFTQEIPDPLEFTLEPLNPDSADDGPYIPEYFVGTIPLFRNDLIESMQRGGVDNLDLYNTEILDPDSGEQLTDHKAVNIIGLVAAADMDASDATVHPGGPVIDVDFDGLVVDEAKAGGLLLFRLAESTNGILVHEKLKEHLVKEGFDRLSFLDPGDCAL